VNDVLEKYTKLVHSSSKTTEIYTRVSKKPLDKIRNPVDDFFD